MISDWDWAQKTSLTKLVLKHSILKQFSPNSQHYFLLTDYMRIGELAQLDLQSIQHRDYFGHLSIFRSIQKIAKIKTSLEKPNNDKVLICLKCVWVLWLGLFSLFWGGHGKNIADQGTLKIRMEHSNLLTSLLDKVRKWHFDSVSNEVIWPNTGSDMLMDAWPSKSFTGCT